MLGVERGRAGVHLPAAVSFAICLCSLLLASPAAAFPLKASDTPNDGGGSISLEWTAPSPVAKEWVLVRRERGGSFAPVTTIEGTVHSFRDGAVQTGVAYEYQLVAQPTDTQLDSEVSAPTRAVASWFDRTKLNVLVVAGIFFFLLFFYIRQAERGVRWTFRKIPGLAAI